jgi:RimJ/RimL family protein N-acetyltransferase
MLTLLTFNKYETVHHLFAPIDHNLAISSILAGLTPGPVFVDRERDPQLAFMWTASRIYVGGNTDDAAILSSFAECISHEFYRHCAESGPGAFTLIYTPNWEQRVQRTLQQQNLLSDVRHYYHQNVRLFDRQACLPAGYSFAPVSRAILEDDRLANRDSLMQEMRSERPSVKDFLEQSIGVCIIHRDTIVGWCLSEYNYQNRCEIGIYTEKAHRCQGLAKASAVRLINMAREIGVHEIGWHCWRGNVASIATATSLGFELEHRAPVLFGYTDRSQNLAMNGCIALRDGSAEKALWWFERAMQNGELPDWAEPYLVKAEKICREGVNYA